VLTMDHIESCAQLEKTICKVSKYFGTFEGNHRWSGWPGAFCLDCGEEDQNEICLAISCKCPCHEAEDKAYEEYVTREKEKGGE